MGERRGVLIAIVSSSLGGTAAAVTRYLVDDADPLALTLLRWGIGFLCLLPVALVLRVRWPMRRDWFSVAALGICSFGLATLARLTAWIISRHAHARSRRRLADLDDRLLRDIGIDRTVVEDDSTSAFWRLR